MSGWLLARIRADVLRYPQPFFFLWQAPVANSQ
jgi:hypothetical protein